MSSVCKYTLLYAIIFTSITDIVLSTWDMNVMQEDAPLKNKKIIDIMVYA